MKTRTINLSKTEIYKDIDALTYKYAEVSNVPSPQAKSDMQSDSTVALDGHILARGVMYRDATLRNVIGRYLADESVMSVSNTLSSSDQLTYNLNLDDEFRDSLLQMLCEMCHRYITWGALYDWYGPGMGQQQAAIYASELQSLEMEIYNNLNAVTIVQKPKQPFGRRLY